MATETRDRFIRRLARLIDFSNEVALNADDSTFMQNSGGDGQPNRRIIYVYDENVFRFIINPDEVRRKYSANFHVADWRNDERTAPADVAATEQYWILLNEMTAVLTGEFLYQPGLKGQADGQIYMSYWHFEQLLDACDAEMLGHLDALATKPHQVGPKAQRHARYEFASALEGGADPFKEKDDPELNLDEKHYAEGLKTHATRIAPSDIERDVQGLRMARRLARVFAQQRALLAPYQVKAITQDIAKKRIKRIEEEFQLTPDDWTRINRNAKGWQEDLADREQERQTRYGTPARAAAGMNSDALTLALVQHIARTKIKPDEARIVFVTGDSLVIDTYRDWYAGRYLKSPGEPNILRSVNYFCPTLNLSDMQSRRSHLASPLFEMLQVALNIALIGFNLSAYSDITLEQETDRETANQKFANLSYLRSALLDVLSQRGKVVQEFFPNALIDNTTTDADRNFSKLISGYQALERNAFRPGRDILERRARRLANDLAEAERMDPFMDYFTSHVRSLVKQNTVVFAPMITQFMNRMDQTLPRDARTPINLRIDVSIGDQAPGPGIVDWVEDLLRGRSQQGRAQAPDKPSRGRSLGSQISQIPPDRAHIVLVAGTIAALRYGRWSHAAKFAELAKKAYRSLSRQKAPDSDVKNTPTYQELRYLAAVTTRFEIGWLGPHRTESGESFSQVETALGNLDASRTFLEQNDDVLGLARLSSERAAVQLFYAAWSTSEDAKAGKFVLERSQQYFDAAVGDLQDAFGALPTFAALAGNDIEAQLQKGIRNQVVANIAAAYAISRLSRVIKPSEAAEAFFKEAKDTFAEWRAEIDMSRMPLSVQLECRLFARDSGLPWDHQPTQGDAAGSEYKLALDDVLTSALRGELSPAS